MPGRERRDGGSVGRWGWGLGPLKEGRGYNAPQYKAAAWMPTGLLTHLALRARCGISRRLRAGRTLLGLVSLALLVMAGPTRANDYEEVSRLIRAGNPAGALARAQTYLDTNPRDPQMLFLRAGALADAGRTQDAMEALKRLTQDYPELPEPYNNLAVLHATQGQLDQAQALLIEALRARPSYALALENLGDVQARLALRAWQQAQQIDPTLAPRTGPKASRVREALAGPNR